MRKVIVASLGAMLLAFSFSALAQQEEPIAEAARKAREQKKAAPKATKVFTNDDFALSKGAISVTRAAPEAAAGAEEKAAEKEKKEEKDEAQWRKRFAEARYNLRQAEKELEVLQREWNQALIQYDPNPNKVMRERFTREEINEHDRTIEAKKKEIEQLRKALSDLEDELRKAGGPPGWARER